MLETAAFIYDELRKLRTRADLIRTFAEKFGRNEGPVPVETILQALIDEGLAVEIVPGAALPAEGFLRSRDLLSEAESRLRAADWSVAEELCRGAGENPAFAEIAELNGLIARYMGGQLEGIIE